MPQPPLGTPEDGSFYLACFPARPIRLSRERPTTIGRADGNTIVLADGQVSRRHAIVEWRDDRFAVRDAGSRNGTFVNDVQVAEGEARELRADDRMRIGERVFTFLQGDEHAVRRLFLHQRRAKHSGVTDVIRVRSPERPAHALSGSLADFGLAELLQALELGRKTGRVAISCETGRGEILLREGQLVGAMLEQLADRDAIYAMLTLETGDFEFEAQPVEADGEPLASTAGLLMEAFRRIDEDRVASGSSPEDGRPEERPRAKEPEAEGQAPSEVRPALSGVAEGQAPSEAPPAPADVTENGSAEETHEGREWEAGRESAGANSGAADACDPSEETVAPEDE